MNTWVIKCFCFFLFCIVGQSSHSQFYICNESENYAREVGNAAFCHTYKIDGFWRQTYLYYEMIDKARFNNRIELINKSYENEEGFYIIQLHIDGKDTLIISTSDSNVCECVLDSLPDYMELTLFGRPNKKVQVPITQKEVPSKITILWGYNDSHGILTIRSKRELDEKTIRSIQRDVSEGRHPYHFDEYYYFISDK